MPAISALRSGGSAAGAPLTQDIMDPDYLGVYGYNVIDAPGVAGAPRNFLTIMNPAGSGRTVAVIGGAIAAYMTSGGSSVRNSMVVYRIADATGGTVAAYGGAGGIFKYQTNNGDGVVVVRYGGPAATPLEALTFVPPPVGSTSARRDSLTDTPVAGPVILLEGEGLLCRTENGDTDHSWDIRVVWGESINIV